MRFLIQRVTNAKVTVDNQITGQISKGFLVFIGIGQNDTKSHADTLVKKMCGLRIFEDENNKTNLSLKDVNGELLLVSQFTLYADSKKDTDLLLLMLLSLSLPMNYMNTLYPSANLLVFR